MYILTIQHMVKTPLGIVPMADHLGGVQGFHGLKRDEIAAAVKPFLGDRLAEATVYLDNGEGDVAATVDLITGETDWEL